MVLERKQILVLCVAWMVDFGVGQRSVVGVHVVDVRVLRNVLSVSRGGLVSLGKGRGDVVEQGVVVRLQLVFG